MTPAEQAREALAVDLDEKAEKAALDAFQKRMAGGYTWRSSVRDALNAYMKHLPATIAALAPAADEVRLRVRWEPIESAPPGKMVLLWNRSWRHAFPGQYTGVDQQCWIDTCEPEAKGWQTHATHWMPLPPAPAAREALVKAVGGEG